MIDVCIPCASILPIEVASCIMTLQNTRKDVKTYFIQNSLVYDARNAFVNNAIRSGADYLLFIDSDIIFTIEDVNRLIECNKDIVTGVYYSRRGKPVPIIYEKIRPRTLFRRIPQAINVKNVKPRGYCAGCGMGFCLIKTKVLRKMVKAYRSPFEPYRGLGEDLAFCYRARKLGYKIAYLSSDTLGHIGERIVTKSDYDVKTT